MDRGTTELTMPIKSRARPLRILLLPVNIASQVSITVQGLRAIGADARGVVRRLSGSVIQSFDTLEILPKTQSKRRPHRWLPALLMRYRILLTSIAWADVVHWQYDVSLMPYAFDIRWAQWLNKPRLVEFWGSDIRIPEVEMADNPYYAQIVARVGLSDPTFFGESRDKSLRTQKLFGEAGYDCLVPCRSMLPYVQKELFPTVYMTRQRILVEEFVPYYPDPSESRPLIVHSPSNPVHKGTPSVLAAIERLQARLPFEFKLIHNTPRRDALRLMEKADLCIDQLIAGGHDINALEAMALGKPVICYIKPSMVSNYPADIPIVNANQDNLEEVLEPLMLDGVLRHELGRQGRAYVEKYHDARKVGQQLVTVYEDVIARHGSW